MSFTNERDVCCGFGWLLAPRIQSEPGYPGLGDNTVDLNVPERIRKECKNQFLQMREGTSRTSEKTPGHIFILKVNSIGIKGWAGCHALFSFSP